MSLLDGAVMRIWYTFIFLISMGILLLLAMGLYYPSKVAMMEEHFFGVVPAPQKVEETDLLRGKYQILAAVVSSYAAAVVALISALVNLVVACYIYRNISVRQHTIQRMTYLTSLEDQMGRLMTQKFARLSTEEGVKPFVFRNVLDEIPWDTNFENKSRTDRHMFIDGDNYVYIRSDGARLSSTALNESIIWFKRIKRALDSKIIDAEDLLVLWRYIICFALSGRYSYFRRYFSDFDWQDMAFVCKAVFRSYLRKSAVLPAHVVRYLDDEFLSDVGLKRSELREA
jgi:hypothetical protein